MSSNPGLDDRPAPVGVTVYWRPGCAFCLVLRRRFRKAGVPTDEVNIWDDPAAAAFVRRHARGNETVPTVDVAGTVLVNPRARHVVDLAKAAGVPITEPGHR
jgi:glutaredoxin